MLLSCLPAIAQQSPSSSQANAGKFRVGIGAGPSRILYSPDPQYTDAAKKARVKGTVVLSIVVGTDGCARDIKVTRKLGYGLDETSVEAMRRWKFKPFLKDGNPVAVPMTVEINFDPSWSPSRSLAAEKECTASSPPEPSQ
jgi:periplasmic protein TonB